MYNVAVIDTTHGENPNFNNELAHAIQELGFVPEVISYLDTLEEIERIKAASAVIIAGVPFHYSENSAEDLQPYLKPWLPEIETPVLGICLGHQAIALTFGGSMRREEDVREREDGEITVEVTDGHEEDPIFNNLGKRFEVVSSHWASVAINRASGLIRLASSAPKSGVSETGCENQIIRVAERSIYGVQFHPEKSRIGKLVLANFLELSSRQ